MTDDLRATLRDIAAGHGIQQWEVNAVFAAALLELLEQKATPEKAQS